jgi:tetratricopeptide (TPR) repeat protein
VRHFFFIFLFVTAVFADSGSSFWWEMALHYKAEGNRVLEKMAIEKVLQIDPFHEKALKAAYKITGMSTEQAPAWEKEQKERISNLLKEEKQQVSLQTQVESGVQEELDYEQRIELMEQQLLSEDISEAQKTQIKRELSQLYYHIGLRSHEEERVHKAIDSFEKAVFYDSEFQLSYYELGFLYFKVRELERGIKNLEKFYSLQSSGTLARFVRETLLNKYILIARRYYFQRDFEKCKPVLEKIQRFDAGSPEAKTALVYLMELYYYQGNQFLEVGDYFSAGNSFYDALEVLKSLPEVDSAFFVRLAKNAVQPFIRTGQKLFIDSSFGEAYKYFEAVTLMVPGTSESFMAREYMKEIERQTGQAENPVVYFSNFVQEESNRFLLEEERRKYLGAEEKF